MRVSPQLGRGSGLRGSLKYGLCRAYGGVSVYGNHHLRFHASWEQGVEHRHSLNPKVTLYNMGHTEGFIYIYIYIIHIYIYIYPTVIEWEQYPKHSIPKDCHKTNGKP